MFFSYLVGVVDNDGSSCYTNEEYPIIEGQFTFHKIEEDEVMHLLSGLNVNKAMGERSAPGGRI